MKIVVTWYGTMALHVVIDGELGLFFDPYLERPEKASPKVDIDPETVEIAPLDMIFVSHSHFDHIYNLPNLIRRYPGVTAYVPEVTVDNLKKFCSGKVFRKKKYPMEAKNWEQFHIAIPGDVISKEFPEAGIKIQATAIKSAHVSFDQASMDRVFNHPDVQGNLDHFMKYMAGFPEKDVIGWEIKVIKGGETRSIVFFGSMCKRYRKIHEKFAGCDLFFIPLAGRQDVFPHGKAMTEVFQPKVVIPVHWDDFFPPISFIPDLTQYERWLADAHPEIAYQKLEPLVPVEF